MATIYTCSISMVLRSPLHNIHEELGARFTEFAGFEMPIQYSSIKDEHLAVRQTVGLFDVSHMSNVWVKGSDAEKLISLTTVEDASKVSVGMSQYTEILREDGTVIDDTIFMHIEDKNYMMIPNAGMNEIVTKWLKETAEKNNLDVEIIDESREYVILAIQGPDSKKTLQKITDINLDDVKFFSCKYAKVAGAKCIVAHTGYTGELGFELHVNVKEDCENVFKKILEAGKEFEIKPVGLGARDTLRLEKCFILAGNEFEGGRTPLESTLSWTINWDHDFIGKGALLKQKEKGDFERLTKLVCIEKAIPRHGCEIQKDGKTVGKVTSGTLSPCLGKGVAMGYVHPDYRTVGDALEIVIRGRKVKTEVVKPPFVSKDWAKHN